MKSVSYKAYHCQHCPPRRLPCSSPKEPLYASVGVKMWVDSRVDVSRYIWELSRGCRGCAEVYSESARVIGNFLARLGIDPLCKGMLEVKRTRKFTPWDW